jgi:hypothetical protein
MNSWWTYTVNFQLRYNILTLKMSTATLIYQKYSLLHGTITKNGINVITESP